MTTPVVAAIVAVADNGVIGRDNGMAWHIPSEFAYFRRMTLGKPVIMGRKSFEALGKPLPKRPNIIVTRDTSWTAPGVTVCHTVEAAIDAGIAAARASGANTVFITGGAEIYAQAMPWTEMLYYTEVHLTPAGQTRFPAFDRNEFNEVAREFHPRQPGDEADYTITVLQRKPQFLKKPLSVSPQTSP